MQRLGKTTKLLIGPWSHSQSGRPVGELNFGFASQQSFNNLQIDYGRLQLRWFDHWLKGIDSGMLAEPPVGLFVMGANVWRDEAEWPVARAVNTPFYFHADGTLTSGADVYRFVMKRRWWAYPLYLLSVMPGGRQVFDRAYRVFARHRLQLSAVCGVAPPAAHGG